MLRSCCCVLYGKDEEELASLGESSLLLRQSVAVVCTSSFIFEGTSTVHLLLFQFTLGECPLDPGGYFVIKGTEKVKLLYVVTHIAFYICHCLSNY